MLISELNTRQSMSETGSERNYRIKLSMYLFAILFPSILLCDANVFVIISVDRSACLPFHQLCKQQQLSHDATNK